MPVDSSGNLYAEVDNIRITYVQAARRADDKEWAGSDVMRIQAYKGEGKRLFPGAEFLVSDDLSFVRMVEALCEVYRTGRVEQ